MTALPDTALLIYLTWGLALIVLVGVLSWSFFRVQRQVITLCERIDQLQGEVHALQRVLRDVHDDGHQTRRLEAELEERVALLSRQQEQLMLRDADTGPYFQAIRQARQGATLDELLERTGISRGEAELILSLHGAAANTDEVEQT
ncbi:MAG: DUF2802 domain-containing protein [Gammaproteobacteria bacterium]|nr:DUF2802 domain-containing protein [Gammaproteobacteria bacterium]TVQ44036.1 MAG: DUF2802 domain-containing protein [Gammaproteobacteria bacterium]